MEFADTGQVIVLVPLFRRRNLLAQASIDGHVDSDTCIRNTIQIVDRQPANSFAETDLYDLSCSVKHETVESLATRDNLPLRPCAT